MSKECRIGSYLLCEKLSVPEVLHGELQERMLPVVGDVGRRCRHLGHVLVRSPGTSAAGHRSMQTSPILTPAVRVVAILKLRINTLFTFLFFSELDVGQGSF